MLIQLNAIQFAYPDGHQALAGIDLGIEKGRNVAFLGANGSGKSSLFLLLAGLLRPQNGTYQLNGRTIGWNRADRSYVSQTLGLVFQDPDVQILNSTVLKEIAYGPTNLGLNRDEVHQRVLLALDQCGIAHLRQRVPHSLSFGQKKSVCIASILAMQTEVIVFDEPMAWLDPHQKNEMRAILRGLHQQGKTVIVSTHSTEWAYEWADEIYVLNQGRILCHGAPDYVFDQTETLHASHLAVPLAFRLSQITGQKIRTDEDIINLLKQ